MIEKLGLRNVRLFANRDFPFLIKPLTLLCGSNSSGKSTLLKSLLFLKQNQKDRLRYDSSQGELHFIGAQFDLGNFHSFVSNNDVNEDATISITIDATDDLSSAFPWFASRRPKSQKSDPFIISASVTFGISRPERHTAAHVSAKDQEAAASLCVIKGAVYNLVGVNTQLKECTVRISNRVRATDEPPAYELLIPKEVFRTRKGVTKISLGEIGGQYRFGTVLDGVFPTGIVERQDVLGSATPKTIRRHALGLHWAADVLDPLGSLFMASRAFGIVMSRIAYVGPVRAAAKRYYYSSYDSPSGMDPTGEFLPHTLLEKKDQMVSYHTPGADHEPREEILATALGRWIHYMREGIFVLDKHFSKEYKVDTPDNIMLSVKLRASYGDKLFPLADTGFGYSQILPILVNGLLAEKGSTVVIEQPELHLNPALQVRIAEFFVALQRAGRQLLVETHSEHIVNAIRVLAAEDRSRGLWSNVSILYFDVSNEGPTVKDLNMQADGNIPEWPREFFGESLELTTRLFSAQRQFISSKLKQ